MAVASRISIFDQHTGSNKIIISAKKNIITYLCSTLIWIFTKGHIVHRSKATDLYEKRFSKERLK